MVSEQKDFLARAATAREHFMHYYGPAVDELENSELCEEDVEESAAWMAVSIGHDMARHICALTLIIEDLEKKV